MTTKTESLVDQARLTEEERSAAKVKHWEEPDCWAPEACVGCDVAIGEAQLAKALDVVLNWLNERYPASHDNCVRGLRREIEAAGLGRPNPPKT